MANSTLDSELFVLQDNWPGPVELMSMPGDGLLDKRYFNVADPAVRVGTKLQLYCNGDVGKAGNTILIYLQVGTQNAGSLLAAKSAVVPDSATLWYQITNDPDDCIKLPTNMIAYALKAMTNAYYGWFWCGGVCPEEFVPTMGGNYATDGAVAAGGVLAHNGTADYIVLGPISGVAEPPSGFALAADAA